MAASKIAQILLLSEPRKCRSPERPAKDYLRYAVWLSLVSAANANRRHFSLATTWVPHLLFNSATLLFPEIYRGVDSLFHLSERLSTDQRSTWSALHATFGQLVLDNPDYIDYIAPATLAYIVSQPRFNIYRGGWAELDLFGFGLDSIPHSSTSYAFSNLIYDIIETLEGNTSANMSIRPYVKWAVTHKVLATGATIAGLTLAYEIGEYLIHKSELKARDHDVSRINMMWSLRDSVFDGVSNAIGWTLATLRRQ